MSTANSTPDNLFGYVRSSDTSTYVGLSGGVLPDAQQRVLIGTAYSQGFTHLFLYGVDGTIAGNVFSSGMKTRLLQFIRLCNPWGIRVGIPVGTISNNTLNAIYDFNQTVATNSSETIDYVSEDEWWNNGYGDFVRIRTIQTAWHANLLASGAVSHAYCGHTKVNGDDYGEDFAIASIVAAGATTTFTVSGLPSGYTFILGGSIRIVGVTGFASNPNGDFVITAAAGNTVSISHTAGAGSYTSGGTLSSMYTGTTELREYQTIFDVFHLHDYVLIPYYGYARRRTREFTIPVQVAWIISLESLTATPPQGNNFSGNFMMGQNAAGVPAYAPKSFTQAYQYITIDTDALGYTPNQVSAPTMYFNADADPNVVANVTVIGLTVFTLSFAIGRLQANGTRMMVFAGADQTFPSTFGSISINDAYAYDDWLPLGRTLFYSWSVVSQPVGATLMTFSNPNGSIVTENAGPSDVATNFNFSAASLGNWVLRLTLFDGDVTITDDLQLFIEGAGSMTITLTELKPVTCDQDCDAEVRATITSGGTGPYDYVYTLPDSSTVSHLGVVGTTDDLTGICAGLVSVTVTDSLGVVATASFNITNPPPLVILLVPTQPTCPGGNDGQIVASISGGSPFGIALIVWRKDGIIFAPADDHNPVNLSLGLYEITVTDNQGCVRVASVNIIEPVTIAETHVIIPPTCNGDADGMIQVNTTGGTGIHTYQWWTLGNPIPGQNANKINGIAAGSYTLVVTDANGCVQSFTFTVPNPPPIVVQLVTIGQADFCLGQFTVDFQAVVISGGTGPFIYQWTGPAILTTQGDGSVVTYDPQASVSYLITCNVTDANGCVGQAQVTGTISAPFTTIPQLSQSNPLGSCPGDTTTLSVDNFGDFDSVLWQDTGDTGPSITVDYPGVFFLLGFNAQGCYTVASITVDVEPTTIQLISSVNNLCGGNGAAGEIDIEVFGGCPGPGYTYEWRDSNGAIIATTQDLTNLPDGFYTVLVTDSLGQTATATYQISTTIADIEIFFTDINGTTGGTATASPLSGVGPFRYIWYSPDGCIIGTQDTVNNLFQYGTYTVIATDANGCVARRTFCLTGPNYSFNMNECELREFVKIASCCFGDKVHESIDMRKNGRMQTCEERHSFLLLNNIQETAAWFPEGMVTCVGRRPYYVFNLTQYSSSITITIRTYTTGGAGEIIVNASYGAGSIQQNVDAIIAAIESGGIYTAFADYYISGGNIIPRIWIYAPIGSGYNGIQVRIAVGPSTQIEIITTNGFQDGCDQKIAPKPCLTEDQVGKMVEWMKQECKGCNCGSVNDIIRDTVD